MKSFCWWRLTLASSGVKPNLVQHMTLTCRSSQGEAKFHWIRSIGRSHGIWVTTFSTHLPLHIHQHSKPKHRNDSTKPSFQVGSWFAWSLFLKFASRHGTTRFHSQSKSKFQNESMRGNISSYDLDLDESIHTFLHVCGAKI